MRMHAMHTGIVMGFGLALGLSQTVVAQVGKSLTLKPATGTHAEEFTTVTSLRELSDGRVLVTDGREQLLLVLDFVSNTASQVGRQGGGPSEYSVVSMLRAAGKDSTLLGDFMQRRVLVLEGSKIVATLPADHPFVSATRAMLDAADSRGNVLVVREAAPPNGLRETTGTDSARVILISRETGRPDTVASVRAAPRRTTVQRDDNNRITASSSLILGEMPTAEQAMLFDDGWLAVARLDPFRVDWRANSGVWSRGTALPVARIKVDARERKWVADRAAAARAPSRRPEGARAILSASPLPPPPAGEFPEFVPPFGFSQSLIAGPAGQLIIKRTRSADYTGSHYFVVDRAGKLVGELSLPANETIVGAGPKSLYIAVKDEDDVIRLRRHPW